VKFEILKSNSYSQPYYWRIVARNGQVLATSETYTSKQGCLDAISAVKREAATAEVIDKTRAAARW
jgi:uncharacterized protein YegP (UPF0339 family)